MRERHAEHGGLGRGAEAEAEGVVRDLAGWAADAAVAVYRPAADRGAAPAGRDSGAEAPSRDPGGIEPIPADPGGEHRVVEQQHSEELYGGAGGDL